jgi:hypothetical protein
MSMDRYPYTATAVKPKGSVFWAAVVMFVGGLVLSFIPFFGGMIAGLVGGKIAGSSERGVFAAVIPAILSGLGILLVGLIHPIIGIIAGIAAFFWAALHLIGVGIGAFIGGKL